MKLQTVEIVSEIKAKTTARLLKDVKVGDVLEFSLPLRSTGHGRAAYVPMIRVTNLHTEETTTFSLNELSKILDRAFVFE